VACAPVLKHRSLIGLLFVSLLLQGCAGIGIRERISAFWNDDSDSVASGERLVAEDFAYMLKMLPDLSPADGPLAMQKPDSSFASNLLVALRGIGYSVVFTDDDTQERLVKHQLDDSDETVRVYSVGVEAVSLGRDYEIQDTGVFPISFMRVKGVASDGLTIDDSRFRRQDRDVTIITGISPDEELLEQQIARQNAQLPLYVSEAGTTEVDKDQITRSNMYETRESNFGKYFAGYDSVEKTVLSFPNDSLRVLPEVKTAVLRLSEQFNPETDIFSVIGCSHGKTALENGNELLAIGRSKRILEELVAAGVPDEKVLDEGCWAPVHFDGKMPRRGVVLDLKRRNNS